MSYKNHTFMNIDQNYYQELVKEADLYKQALQELQYLRQEIGLLTRENHLLKQQLKELETKKKW